VVGVADEAYHPVEQKCQVRAFLSSCDWSLAVVLVDNCRSVAVEEEIAVIPACQVYRRGLTRSVFQIISDKDQNNDEHNESEMRMKTWNSNGEKNHQVIAMKCRCDEV
jgi:hypothetical protein